MALTDEQEKELKAAHEKAINDAKAAHQAELDKLKKKGKKVEEEETEEDDEEEDDDKQTLADKARKAREEQQTKTSYEKSLGTAMKFNMGAKDFLKNNEGLLPKTIEGIFTAAEKESYDSEIEKANEIKVGVVSEFFAVQSNMDQLTGGQKVELEDFLKLTKNVKKERIENIYAMIFEPVLENIRKVEKAKQVGAGSKDQSSAEKMLAERMMKQSKAHYLGDKQ